MYCECKERNLKDNCMYGKRKKDVGEKKKNSGKREKKEERKGLANEMKCNQMSLLSLSLSLACSSGKLVKKPRQGTIIHQGIIRLQIISYSSLCDPRLPFYIDFRLKIKNDTIEMSLVPSLLCSPASPLHHHHHHHPWQLSVYSSAAPPLLIITPPSIPPLNVSPGCTCETFFLSVSMSSPSSSHSIKRH